MNIPWLILRLFFLNPFRTLSLSLIPPFLPLHFSLGDMLQPEFLLLGFPRAPACRHYRPRTRGGGSPPRRLPWRLRLERRCRLPPSPRTRVPAPPPRSLAARLVSPSGVRLGPVLRWPSARRCSPPSPGHLPYGSVLPPWCCRADRLGLRLELLPLLPPPAGAASPRTPPTRAACATKARSGHLGRRFGGTDSA